MVLTSRELGICFVFACAHATLRDGSIGDKLGWDGIARGEDDITAWSCPGSARRGLVLSILDCFFT